MQVLSHRPAYAQVGQKISRHGSMSHVALMHVVWQTDCPGWQRAGSSHSARSCWTHGVFEVPVVVLAVVETVDADVVVVWVPLVLVEELDAEVVVGEVLEPVDVDVSVVLLTQVVMLQVASHSCACAPVALKMVAQRE